MTAQTTEQHHEQCPWHKADPTRTRSVCGCPEGWPKTLAEHGSKVDKTETGWVVRVKQTGEFHANLYCASIYGDATVATLYESREEAEMWAGDGMEIVSITRTITVEIGEPES